MGRNKKATSLARSEEQMPMSKKIPSPSEAKKTKLEDEIIGIQPLRFYMDEDSPKSISGTPGAASSASVVRNTVDDLDLTAIPIEPGVNVKISFEDIEGEINYWKPSVICHILGGNPPLAVFQGFVKKIWQSLAVEKVASFGRGFYIVKFDNVDTRNRALEGGIHMFDKKPVVISPWTADFDVNKVDETMVPIWARLPGLPLKYWNSSVLAKIAGSVGKPVIVDKATAAKELLNYARILIEVDIQNPLPTEVRFQNENNEVVTYKIEFEWRPIRCAKCEMFGHIEKECKEVE